LGSNLGAFFMGAAVTCGPWLLTTMVLVVMRLVSVHRGQAGITEVEQMITLIHAVALVIGAPIDIAMSRFASDCLYQQRPDRIVAPLRRVLAFALVGFALLGWAWMAVWNVRPALALPSVALLIIIGTEWLLLSAAGGLSSPGTVLRAFVIGAPISIVSAFVLAQTDMLGVLGYLYGFGVGQAVTLTMLLFGTLHALPPEEDEYAAIGPMIPEYVLLIAAAFAIHAGIWIDKLVVYLLGGAGAASHYAALAALAWFTAVPTFAYVYVQVETGFYERFRAFYGTIHSGATLGQLNQAVDEIERDAKRLLSGAILVQVSVGLLAVLAAPRLLAVVGMGPSSVDAFRILVVGSMFQAVAMCGTLLLYYFDLRREALIGAGLLLVANGLLTTFVDGGIHPMGLGYATACALACASGVILLRRRLGTLLRDTFQLQPYAFD
jgi:polysaccharide biosynthesis protein PelG